jgi:TPR repeat protein
MHLKFFSRCLFPVLAVLFSVGASLAIGQLPKSRVLTAAEIEHIQKKAEQGDLVAQFFMASSHEIGNGVVKSAAEAVKWYRMAAEQGDDSAQYTLGKRYSSGEGVEKDEAEAAMWYRKAAEQGNEQAWSTLGHCYLRGKGVRKSTSEAAKWLRKAAEEGDSFSQLSLGTLYQSGDGIPKNDLEAYKWYLLAAAKGLQTAKENATLLERNLTPEQRAEAQRLATEFQDALDKKDEAEFAEMKAAFDEMRKAE